eukprot:m.23420 g.23420  ORF g.23420 m.23420 type:complete len:100 (+) comp4119_c0_seq1:1270-1569(+)
MSGKDRVLRDSDVPGGSWRRDIDHSLSEKLGGYRSLQKGTRTEPSAYGKYVEPVIHATEHAARGVYSGSKKEFARAADELRSVGEGLHKADTKYQDNYK